MPPPQHESGLLRERLTDLLVDGEEYLEELYLGCNFDVLGDASERSWRTLGQRFRLAEIIIELGRMTDQGLVTARAEAGWPPEAGIGSVCYSLTQVGRALWDREIKGRAAGLYE